MSLLKNVLLASLLMFTTIPAQAGDLTRAQFKAVCTDQGLKAGNDSTTVRAVCNCAAQLISYVGSDGTTPDADYSIPNNHPILGEAVQVCVRGHNADTELFMEQFGTLSVSNDESQEGT